MVRHEETEVIIIGAGPGGSLAGATLANRGRKVIALEREYFPRFVIGESQLPRSTQLLEEAGLLDDVLSRNFMKKYAATFKMGNQTARIVFGEGLPGDAPMAFQTPRGLFDQVLATGARKRGVDVRFGHQVDAVEFHDDRVTLHATDLEYQRKIVFTAKWLIDCSGYGRVLPKLLDLEATPSLSSRKACFTMFEGDERPDGQQEGDVWINSIPSLGWGWLIPFADGRTSVGFLTDAARYDALADNDRDRLLEMVKLEPNTAHRLRKAVPALKVQQLQGWTRQVTRMFGPRWLVAGNAGDFIDPIFSSGVMLAMESATLAGKLVHRALDGEPIDWMSDYQDVMKRATDVFRAFAQSWYDDELVRIIYSSDVDADENIRRSIVSILGGNVLNQKNSLVRNPDRGLKTVLALIEQRHAAAAN
jgi:flavin-dependent dehydrogenase